MLRSVNTIATGPVQDMRARLDDSYDMPGLVTPDWYRLRLTNALDALEGDGNQQSFASAVFGLACDLLGEWQDSVRQTDAVSGVATTVEIPAQNGSAPAGPPAPPTFPVDSFREAAIHLRRPFTPAAVKFKVQATWPKDNPSGGLIVGYIDARLVVERLNLILPHLWHDEYEPVPEKGHLMCRLTIDGITRRDVGEGVGKGLYSDALKRAAVKFGIGVSLYAIPKMILDVDAGTVKQRMAQGKKTLEITPKGDTLLRSMYEHWLDQHGRHAFGDPLDHGDLEGAAGDAETEAEGETITPEEPDPAAPSADFIDRLRGWFKEFGWTVERLRLELVALGSPDVSDIAAAMRALTQEQANLLAEKLYEQIIANDAQGGE